MKVSFALLLVMVLMLAQTVSALTIDTASPYWQWFMLYLEGMDELLLLAWRNIYYYTWLVLAQWILCTWFCQYGAMFIPDVDASECTTEMGKDCNDGISKYFDATMYGGNTDNLPYDYFRPYPPIS